MNNCPGRGTGDRSPRLRRGRAAAVVTATIGLALLAAACSTGSGGSPNAGGSASSSTLVAYSQCMRSHGIANFPDPDSSGGIPKEGVISAYRAVSNSRVQAAQNDCSHLLPAGASLNGRAEQTITAPQQHYYLKAAACMRSHGFTNFPDPVFSGGSVDFSIPSSIDTSSTRFTQARQICARLIPAGLPDSGSGSGG